MAIERRDIELALRAKDEATPTFVRARQAVDRLTTAIEQQARGVRTGETALDELRNTYRELEQTAKALGQQQGLIDSFRKQSQTLATFEQKATEARQKADAFSASLAGVEKVSVRAEQRQAALIRIADRSAASFQRQQERVEKTRAALDAAGIETRDLDGASKSLLATSQRVGAAFTTLNTVISGYSREVKAGQAAERAAAAEQAAVTQRRQAALKAFNDQVKEQARLRAAVLAAETAAAREANAAAQATEKQTQAFQEQAAAVDRLLASRGRLSNVNVQLAREQGRGNAEQAVRQVTQPTSGLTNLRQIETAAAAQAAAVATSLGKPVNNFLGLLQDLERSLANVQRVAKQVDGYQAQRAAVIATLEEYRRARDNLRNLNAEFKRNPTGENAAAVRAAVPAYERARAAFNEQSQALRVLREGLKQAGVGTKDFTATQARLVEITRRTDQSIKDLTKNFERFGGSAREGPAGFFGLRPYEIQNLSFQINDFFTQLASGASVTQAFAQQIGQVAQIQPIWQRIVAFAPAFITLGAAIGVTTAALSRLYQTAESDRRFEASLLLLTGGNTQGIGVTAQQLTALARRIEQLGFAFDDARKAAVAFLNEGLAPANLAAGLEAAARLSRARGIEFADAVKIITDALRGGVGATVALREAQIVLSNEQRDAIIAAASINNEFERQQAVLNALLPLLRQADDAGLSPLTRAINGAKEAWRGFLDALGETVVFQVLKSAIDAVVAGLGNMRAVGITVARALTNAFVPLSNVLNFIAGVLRNLGRAVDLGPAIVDPASGAAGAGRPSTAGPSGQAPIGDTAAELAAQRTATRRELELIRDDRRRSRQEREAAALRLARIEVDAANQGATAQTRAYLAQLELLKFREQLDQQSAGGGGGSAARRDFQAISQDLQNIIRARDEAIRGIQEDVATGGTAAAEGIARIQQEAERARPAIERLRAEAQRFLDTGRGGDAVRTAAIERVIAQADRELAGQAAGGRAARTGTAAILRQQEQEIRQQFQERANFIQTQNALEQQGVVTREEAERRILALYGETRAALEANIAAYRAASEAAAQNRQITQSAAAANAAQIELWSVQLERINPQWARMKQGIENVLTQSATTAFDSIAKAIGDVLAGVTSLEEGFEAAGRAALQFVADVLKGIAQVIIQEQVLQAVRLVTKAISSGLFHSGGVVGQAGGARRSVNPAVFAGAPRMHSGGVVGGLAADERAAILKTGEEVLTRDDPRNILNRNRGAAAGGEGPTAIRNVLAVGDQEIANAMSGAAGEQVIFNMLKRNAPTLRALVRG